MKKSTIQYTAVIQNIHKLLTKFITLKIQNDEDLPYEQDILRNPYSVKCWLRYVEHKGSASTKQVSKLLCFF